MADLAWLRRLAEGTLLITKDALDYGQEPWRALAAVRGRDYFGEGRDPLEALARLGEDYRARADQKD